MISADIAPEPALSSLIFTVSAAEDLRVAARQALARFPGLTLGEPQGRWIPGVLEAMEPEQAFRALEALPGIDLVEVVYVEVSAPADELLDARIPERTARNADEDVRATRRERADEWHGQAAGEGESGITRAGRPGHAEPEPHGQDARAPSSAVDARASRLAATVP